MGIPLYFKKITDEYEDIVIDTKKLNSVKRLFLDLNCAIHPCCRRIVSEGYDSNNNDKYEKYMISEILNYIELIFNTVKPTNLLYIAIDGVAPKAKMSQQRLRRFKTIKERELKNKIKSDLGEEIENSFWDTNAITPGTNFINKIAKSILSELKNNIMYKNVDIIFSDSSVVGEGEHKIFNYIRNNHIIGNDVVYGLDADLIMLSLASHKSSVYLLRESLEFGKMYYESGYKFLYLDIDCLKSYIIMEIKSKLIGDYVYEESLLLSLIDDYVVMCFILGNDFLPHIPSLDLRNNGLSILLEKYTYTYLEIGETLVDINTLKINTKFLRALVSKLSIDEDDILKKMSKRRKKFNIRYKKYDSELEKRLDLLHNYPILNTELEDYINIGEEGWKNRYYDKCLGMYDQDDIDAVCHNFLEGIVWTFNYYYKDCISWQWSYLYGYAPTLSDLSLYLNKIGDINKITIPKSRPNKPCQQLLLVLPPDSYKLLPKSYQFLTTIDNSPLIEYFPKEYELETCYKRYFWQCSPILPLINSNKVKNVLSKIKLTRDEQKRNEFGEDIILQKSIKLI